MRGLNKCLMVVQVYAIAHIALNLFTLKLILSSLSLFLQRVNACVHVFLCLRVI